MISPMFVSRLVAMTAPQHTKNESIEACPLPADPTDRSALNVPVQEEFHWSPQTQGLVLGSFFYGYVLTQVLGGKREESMSVLTLCMANAIRSLGRTLRGEVDLWRRDLHRWAFDIAHTAGRALSRRSSHRCSIIDRSFRSNSSDEEQLSIRVVSLHLGSGVSQCCRPVGSMDSTVRTKYHSSDRQYWQRDRHCSDHPVGQSTVCLDVSRWLALGFLPHRCVSSVHNTVDRRSRSGLLSCLWFVGWSLFAFNSPAEHPRITYEEKLFLLRSVPKPKKVSIRRSRRVFH